MEKGTRTTEKVDISDSPFSDGVVKRIFIGGVGTGVTSADMVKTFSPLGSIHAVDFVRTNGRNFAFMDFEPSSVKAMANLFSTYNGCTWKGGKLKLEMAKEHYIARLKREWAGDAKLASAPLATEENLSSVRSHLPNQENSQIRIFFPKLRKVKPLPFKGTGKHKYSFQRIEVSPSPIHFCDCEEHSKALETTSQKYLSPLTTVVHEKEQNLINNVLNKLMEGDRDNTASGRKIQAASGPNTSSQSVENIHCIEQEVSDTDEDNLVMNIGIRAGNDIFLQSKGATTTLTGQDSGFSKPKLVHDKADSGKRKKSEPSNASFIKPNKRAHSVSADGLSKREPAPITQNVASVLSTPAITSECPADMPNLPAKIPTAGKQDKPNLGIVGPVDSHSWVQKASWKDLVGGEERSSFSISTLLSGVVATASTKILAKSVESDSIAIPVAKKPVSSGEKSNQMPRTAQISSGMNPKGSPSKDSSYNVQEKTVGCETSIVQKQMKVTADCSFGGVCPFMRSTESEHEWLKAKAALNGFIKRKGSEDNVSKFKKGMERGKR